MWVPQDVDANVVMSLELGVEFGAPPVPDVDFAVSVAARDVAVGTPETQTSSAGAL